LAKPDESTGKAKLSERGRRRLATVIVLSSLTGLLLLSLIAQGGFNLSPFLSPGTAGQTLLLYALSTLNFLAFITLFFVLLRNVLKLIRERRAGRLGSKFKARLVSYSIGLSLLPVLLLFFFAFGLLNRTVDRWLGEPTRQIVEDSHALETEYFEREELELTSLTRSIGDSLQLEDTPDYHGSDFASQVKQAMDDYGLALVRVVAPGQRVTFQTDGKDVAADIDDTLDIGEHDIRDKGQPTFAGKDDGTIVYTIAAVRFSKADKEGPILMLAREFPRAVNIDAHYTKILDLRKRLKPIKDIYILMLALVTLLLIFAAVWLALHVARGITVPIQALAEATDRVAHGDFTHRVDVVAEDELAGLVDSFNQMAGQLEENREQLDLASEDLRRTNLALSDRGRYIETVLESLSTGVISTDDRSGIATINVAALKMLGLSEKPASGTPIDKIIDGLPGQELATLCRRARRAEKAHADIDFLRPDGSTLQAATTAIALRNSEGVVGGWVIVMEDLSDLILAERAAAWSEVARRMAHEIKNPLTPIQLSAERIMRNFKRGTGGRFEDVVTEGTSTIVREVGTLQRMVEEFSRFARLPEATLIETPLNAVILDTVKLYAERLDGISIECNLSDELPLLNLDPEQMKRVLVNLIDNAIEALTTADNENQATVAPNDNGGNTERKNASGLNGKRASNGANHYSSSSSEARVIRIESIYVGSSETARIIISDNGHGINAADRDKLFLPKFSTRERGTGLGLAIVSHIVSDHKGRISVENNRPRGAKFIIDLPVG
jgi:two-component system, NtrC family, nitrogen regulation sensor histidine kinase NtrY